MPVSIEYMDNLIRESSVTGLSSEDRDLIRNITAECWFAMAPTLLPIITEVRQHTIDNGKVTSCIPLVLKSTRVLRNAKVSCIDDCISLLNILGASFKYELLQNKHFPIEILMANEYFDRFKKADYFKTLNTLRAALVVSRSHESAAFLRKQLRQEFPDVDSMTDDMVLSVAGINLLS